jgi:hypothetical protein
MKPMLAIVALGLSAAFAMPVDAQVKEPRTKAECQNTKGMKWDDKTGKCMKKIV